MTLRKSRRVELGPGKGKIGSLFDDKGYGFIVNNNPDLDDLFFHFSEYPIPSNIESGTEVSFVCVQNDKTGKYKAQNIKILRKATILNAPSASYDGHRMQYTKTSHNRVMHQAHNMQYNKTNHLNVSQNINTNQFGISQAIQPSQPMELEKDRPKLGCFKLVKKDVTDRPMYVPVYPLKGSWKHKKQFL